jgi:glucokinase
MFVGIEIGGTKLQLGLGDGTGTLAHLWRGPVDVAAGGSGIRRQITAAFPELLAQAGVERSVVRGIGVGFGGPVDDATRTVITSHQIAGWDGFPLADWLTETFGLPVALGNDADVAGLAEALFGAGRGLSPIFYVTIGSGIGGSLINDGQIYRGCGRGAAEIGHLRHDLFYDAPEGRWMPLEALASGWGIENAARQATGLHALNPERHPSTVLAQMTDEDITGLTAKDIARAAEAGDSLALEVLDLAWDVLAESICHVITLLCPRRIVIGGGVSLMGERLLFEPLRRKVAERAFQPFAGLTEIVPAALGEEVVVHGALALARQRAGR